MSKEVNIVELCNLLGRKAKDKVTGFSGVIISVSVDLFGCLQAIIQPEAKEGETYPDGRWFDTNRLLLLDAEKVMEPPIIVAGDVGESPEEYDHGPADKPLTC